MQVVWIESYGLVLRPFTAGDAGAIVEQFADPSARRWTAYDAPVPYTEADAHAWIATHPGRFAGGGAVLAVSRQGELSGAVELHEGGPAPPDKGSIGYWTLPAARGQGVATRATRAVTRWAFEHGFARLELTTHPENGASQRVALAAGFRREGVLRQCTAGPRGREDRVLYARLAEDPDEPTPRALPDLREPLTDGVVAVRPQRLEDAEAVFACLSDAEYRRWLPVTVADRSSRTLAAVRSSVARSDDRWLAGEQAVCTVVATATGEPVGQVTLRMTEREIGTAQLGWSTVPAQRGRGYASSGVRLLARWAFDVVGMHRLEASAGLENAASRRVGAKAGFREEGVLRAGMIGPAGHYDLVLFALVRDDLVRDGLVRDGPVRADMTRADPTNDSSAGP